MKKTFLIISLIAIAGSAAPHVLAQGNFIPLAGIPGLTEGVDTSSTAMFATFFNNLYKYLIGVAATLAVVEIIWGGFEISTKDSVSKQADGKERITQALFGLVLVLSPVLVFSLINPSILDLSLTIQPITNIKTGEVSTNPLNGPSGSSGGQYDSGLNAGYYCGVVEAGSVGYLVCDTPSLCAGGVDTLVQATNGKVVASCAASSTATGVGRITYPIP